ncbi:MAG TPA: hypothetical protein VLM89_16790 [Phycisphaerae bacterium]|nr:hypothetical protein [Phycisphaerae bacterium]
MMRFMRLMGSFALLGCCVTGRAETPETSTSPASMETSRPILTPEAKLAAGRSLVDRFVQHVRESSRFPAHARQAVNRAWADHRADEQPQDFLTAALTMICEPFKKAMDALDQQEYDEADRLLQPLLAETDPYIGFHARAALARSLLEQDRLEEARSLLAGLAGRRAELIDRSFLEVKVDFLLAYCLLTDLQYEPAVTALERFEQLHPDAPDKYRLPARQMLNELRARRTGGLGDVSDLMTHAGRRLNRGLADERARQSQQRAVDLLAELIKQAEEMEKQQQQASSAGGPGGSRGGRGIGNRPGRPAEQSMLPEGPGAKGDLEHGITARPGEMWGQMRPEERQRILQSLRDRFPSRYRQLVEQYYRQLAKEP